MKKIFAVFLLCIGWHSLLAQGVCGTEEMMRQLMKKDPLLKVRMEQNNEKIRQYMSSRIQGPMQHEAQKPYKIRVVVHVISDVPLESDGTTRMINKKDIEDAIENLKNECNNSRTQFFLAKKDPNGIATNGIDIIDASTDVTYVATGVEPHPFEDFIFKNKSRWPSDKYLNIWVVNKINAPGAAGYGISHTKSPELEGIVIRASSIKSTTLPHETGHFFELEHVYHGCWVPDPIDPTKIIMGDCDETHCPPADSPGDYVDDTDPVQGPSNGNPRTGPNPCCTAPGQNCRSSNYTPAAEGNIMNSTSSRCGLTPGQKEREIASLLNNYKGLIISYDEESLYEQKALSKFYKQIRSVVSIDPNEKVGMTTNTAANHVNGAAPFNYNIYFENKNTASAPAQEVVIIDTLDTSKFDLSTFQLRSFGYGGSTKAHIPVGLTEYFVVDTLRRPGKPNLLVKTDAKLDTAKGILTWHFLSLDPQTRELVTDPLDGFLPPNITSPQGEGYVSYSVAPKMSLTHETVIKNKAFIYFDNNEPIVTNEFLNTLDKVNPISSVNPTPQQVYDTSFTVQWNGSDNGAGIRSYDVYYKVNNGEYKLWQYDVSLLSSEFPGQKDSTYSFFSISKDYAGNIEPAKTTAERVVTIKVYDSTTTACNGAITKFNATPAETGFTYQWQVNTGNGYADIANSTVYSGVSTVELTLANPPTGYTNYQYRCKISNSTVTYYSSKHALRFVSTWIGTTSSAWEAPSNWSCGIVPDENTHVVIPASVPHNPIVNVNGTCKSLTMNSASNVQVKTGVTLTITGKLND